LGDVEVKEEPEDKVEEKKNKSEPEPVCMIDPTWYRTRDDLWRY
jgi:hypothetical protein